MQDWRGVDLAIGQQVLYSWARDGSVNTEQSEIVGFTPKKVKIKQTVGGHDESTVQPEKLTVFTELPPTTLPSAKEHEIAWVKRHISYLEGVERKQAEPFYAQMYTPGKVKAEIMKQKDRLFELEFMA